MAAEFAHRSHPAPDPYSKATLRVAERQDAIAHAMDLYAKHGIAPDGYTIGLALRRVVAEVKAEETAASRELRTATEARAMVRDANGVPDGYQTALAARRASR